MASFQDELWVFICQRKLTSTEFAKATRVSVRTLYGWLSGDHLPHSSWLERFSKTMRVTITVQHGDWRIKPNGV